MESYKKTAILSVLLVVVGMANAQMICNMSVASIMACKPSAVAPNPPPPSGTCCSALSHANITCLCSYKNSKVLPSLGIDPNLAMQLPQKCKLPHPSQCQKKGLKTQPTWNLSQSLGVCVLCMVSFVFCCGSASKVLQYMFLLNC